MSNAGTGYFLLSLDTELAWGHYDSDKPDSYAVIAERERHAIQGILDILDEFHIVATWGVVGHLFYLKCEECELCPVMDWKDRYPAFDLIRNSDPNWYRLEGSDLLLRPGSRHEIAFHGYTHKLFDEEKLTREEANIEIQEWKRAARPWHVVPKTVIFPRNKVGHLRVLKEAGFTCFRGPMLTPKSFSLPIIGRVLKLTDSFLPFAVPEVYDLDMQASGMVNLPSSRRLLGTERRIQTLLDTLHLHSVGINRIVRGVERAAKEGKVIHVASHPYEFSTAHDFGRLRYLLSHVAEHVAKGRLRSVGMSDLAAISLDRG